MHLPWVDLIRVIAIYLVVVVHVSGQLTNIWGEIPNSQWLIADIYGGIARISVAIILYDQRLIYSYPVQKR